MKELGTLNNCEVRRANMAMNKFTGRTDCRVAEYSVSYINDSLTLVSVTMSFCAGDKMEINIEPALIMIIDLNDRRLSYVSRIIEGDKVYTKNNKEYKMTNCDWTIVKKTLDTVLPGVIDYEVAPDVQCRQGHSVFDIFYHTVNGDKMHLIYHANVKTRTLGHINEIINRGNNKHLMFDANNKPVYAANIGCYASSMADLLSSEDYRIYCDEMDAKSGIREQIETFAHTWISDSAEIIARDDTTPGIHYYMVGEYELSGEDANGFEIYEIVKEYPYEFLVDDAYDNMYVRNTDTGEQTDKFDFDALMAVNIDVDTRIKRWIINYLSVNAALIIKPSDILLLVDGDDTNYNATVRAGHRIFRMDADVGLTIALHIYYISDSSREWHSNIDDVLRMIRLRGISPEDVAVALSGLTHLEVAHTLELMGYKLHHGAQVGGYIKKHDGASVSPYNGRFGSGYCLHYPSRRSTVYHYCEYWLA